jgi:hypothetical protein
MVEAFNARTEPTQTFELAEARTELLAKTLTLNVLATEVQPGTPMLTE